MGRFNWMRRGAAASMAAACLLLLGGCLLMPGKFAASLELRKGGAFTYRYDGEIHLLALSKLAEMGSAASSANDDYVEQPCHDDDFEERECTAEERAEARAEWDAGADKRKADKEREAEMTRAMLGGIDPADPEAAQELAARIRRQKGWSRVDYKGDGLFDVSFALMGRIDHDFLFPTFEGFPMSNVFVALTRRTDGTVRVDAPGFSQQAIGSPFQGMMAGMAGAFAAAGSSDEKARIPMIEGTFEIVTDGEVLANNTDEGVTRTPAGQALRWTINRRTKSPPMALIRVE